MVLPINGYDFTVVVSNDVPWIQGMSDFNPNAKMISYAIDWDNPLNLNVGFVNKDINIDVEDESVNEEVRKLETVYAILTSRWKSDFINDLVTNLPEDINIPFGYSCIYFWWDASVECVQYGTSPKMPVPANTGGLLSNLVLISLLIIYLMLNTKETRPLEILNKCLHKYTNILENDKATLPSMP